MTKFYVGLALLMQTTLDLSCLKLMSLVLVNMFNFVDAILVLAWIVTELDRTLVVACDVFNLLTAF